MLCCVYNITCTFKRTFILKDNAITYGSSQLIITLAVHNTSSPLKLQKSTKYGKRKHEAPKQGSTKYYNMSHNKTSLVLWGLFRKSWSYIFYNSCILLFLYYFYKLQKVNRSQHIVIKILTCIIRIVLRRYKIARQNKMFTNASYYANFSFF